MELNITCHIGLFTYLFIFLVLKFSVGFLLIFLIRSTNAQKNKWLFIFSFKSNPKYPTASGISLKLKSDRLNGRKPKTETCMIETDSECRCHVLAHMNPFHVEVYSNRHDNGARLDKVYLW